MTQRSRVYIVRSRDGKPLNIDALKSQAKKPPATPEKPAEAKKKAESKPKCDPKETKAKQDKLKEDEEDHASKDHEMPSTTPEQDAKLLAMKGDNKTWAEIAEALGHSKSVWRTRFKQLQATRGQKNEDAKGNDEKRPKDNNNEAKSSGAKTKKAQQEKAQKTIREMLEGNASEPALHKGVEEPKMSLSELVEFLEEDNGHFSAWDLRDLQRMIQEDEAEKWLRLASKFYDRTGRRIHEYDIRDKADRLRQQFGAHQ